MRKTFILAVFTSSMLFLLGAGVYAGWRYTYAKEGVFNKLSEATVTKLSTVSDPVILKKAAVMLTDNQNKMSDDMNGMLNDFIYVYFLACMIGVVSIWMCTLSAAKAYRKAKDIELGWLKWF